MKNNFYKIKKVLLIAIVIIITVFSSTNLAFAQTPRQINDFKNLFLGGEQPSDRDVMTADASGILYIGPVSTTEIQAAQLSAASNGSYKVDDSHISHDAFDSAGNLKKIGVGISLSLNNAIPRAWDAVGSTYFHFVDLVHISNGYYLRFLDQSFIVRTYQLDDNNKPINESLSPVPVKSFLGGDNASSSSYAIENALAAKAIPMTYITKYNTGSAFWHNIGCIGTSDCGDEDGYSKDGTGISNTTAGVTGGVLGALAFSNPITGIVVGAGTLIATNKLVSSEGPTLYDKQTVVTSIDINANLDKTKPVYMELWYLGSDRLSTKDDSYEPAGKASGQTPPNSVTGDTNDKRIRYFNSLKIQGGYDAKKYPYFQIGKTVTFNPPTSLQDAQTQNAAAIGQVGQIKSNAELLQSALPACSISNGKILGFGSDGTFLGCIAQLFYYAIYSPIQWFAGIMGKVFDFFLGYSLDDQSYRADFIVTAWKVVRDFCNIFFILILIYTGIAAVFNIGKVSMKQVVPHLIINALIINFSLFATRIAVDASNIFARVFYNQIQACVGECHKNADGVVDNSAPTIGGYKQVSPNLVSIFNPQKLFSTKVISIDSLPTAIQYSTVKGESVTKNITDRNSYEYALYFIVVSAIAAAIVFAIAMMFWKVGFFFLGRVIGIYIVMIFSPFAFLTRENMPLVGGISRLKWTDWLKELTAYSLLAPIFAFFLVIIYGLATSPFINQIKDNLLNSNNDIIPTILSIAIPLLIVYFLIKQGVDIAKTYAGYVGEKVQQFASKAVGYTAGAGMMVATGGAAFLGTTVGSRAGKLLGKTKLGTWASTNAGSNLFARKMSNALDWTQKSSWDLRKTKAGNLMKGNKLFTEMGLSTTAGAALANKAGFGESHFEGGAIGRAKRREERKDMKERITGFSYLSKEAAEKAWQNEQDRLIGEEAMRGYMDKISPTFKKQSDTIKNNEKEIKDLKKKIKEAEFDVQTNNKLSADDKKKRQTELEGYQKDLSKKQSEVSNLQVVQKQLIQETRNDKTKEKAIRESKEYKDSYSEAKKKSDIKFGRVENAKDYENAMRRVYVENLRENSFWMANGKQRSWLPALGVSGALGGLLTKFGTAVNTAIGGVTMAVASERIKEEQEAIDAATQSFLKGYDKTKKSANKIVEYKDRLKKIEELLKEQLAEAYTTPTKPVTKDDIDLSAIDQKEQESKIKQRIEELRAQMDLESEKYKKVAEDFRKGTAGVTQDHVKTASKAKKAAEDKYNDLRNIWKDQRDAEDGIDKEQSK